MNKAILFLCDFSNEDNTYSWIANTKYGLAYEDTNFYYIKRIKNNIIIKPYPITKDLEHTVYTIVDINKGG